MVGVPEEHCQQKLPKPMLQQTQDCPKDGHAQDQAAFASGLSTRCSPTPAKRQVVCVTPSSLKHSAWWPGKQDSHHCALCRSWWAGAGIVRVQASRCSVGSLVWAEPLKDSVPCHDGSSLRKSTVCYLSSCFPPKRVLRARQKDSLLPACPLHDDVTTLQGATIKSLQAKGVGGGFPCQAG